MQERSDVPYGHASMLLLGEGSEATDPYNKYDKFRPHSIRYLQFDQKVRPLSFRPEKFDLFTATPFGRHYCRRNGLKFLSPKWLVTKRTCPTPLGAAYFLILLSEVEQEQKLSGNGDREAIVVDLFFATAISISISVFVNF